jgi:hypothetical protein
MIHLEFRLSMVKRDAPSRSNKSRMIWPGFDLANALRQVSTSIIATPFTSRMTSPGAKPAVSADPPSIVDET